MVEVRKITEEQYYKSEKRKPTKSDTIKPLEDGETKTGTRAIKPKRRNVNKYRPENFGEWYD
jgi:hypothetical protein